MNEDYKKLLLETLKDESRMYSDNLWRVIGFLAVIFVGMVSADDGQKIFRENPETSIIAIFTLIVCVIGHIILSGRHYYRSNKIFKEISNNIAINVTKTYRISFLSYIVNIIAVIFISILVGNIFYI